MKIATQAHQNLNFIGVYNAYTEAAGSLENAFSFQNPCYYIVHSSSSTQDTPSALDK
jgi:hypothetical protein